MQIKGSSFTELNNCCVYSVLNIYCCRELERAYTWRCVFLLFGFVLPTNTRVYSSSCHWICKKQLPLYSLREIYEFSCQSMSWIFLTRRTRTNAIGIQLFQWEKDSQEKLVMERFRFLCCQVLHCFCVKWLRVKPKLPSRRSVNALMIPFFSVKRGSASFQVVKKLDKNDIPEAIFHTLITWDTKARVVAQLVQS